MRTFFLSALALLLVTSAGAYAQELPPASDPDTLSAPADTLDAVGIPGETATPDTIRRIRVPAFSGSPGLSRDSALIIPRAARYRRPHRSVGGMFTESPGVFFLDQSSDGQYSALAPRGADWRAMAVLRDGKPLADPGSGVFNLSSLPVEDAEVFELITGPRAFLYGFNAAGGALNIVTRMDDNNRPASRITYSESGAEFTRTDGSFAQNISRRVNVAAGFQALGTDGRFANAGHEQWDARVRLRTSPLDDLHVAFSYNFHFARTALNGGVDAAASGTLGTFDPLRARVLNTDSYEKVTRDEAEVRVFGPVTGDSSALTVLSLYYTRQLREYRDEENRSDPNGLFIQHDHVTSWMGGVFRQDIRSGDMHLSAGGHLELRQVEGSPSLSRRRNSAGAVWGFAEVPLTHSLAAAGYFRYDGAYGRSALGLGADVRVALNDAARLTAGISSAARMAGYQERFWEGPDVGRTDVPDMERHLLAEVRADVRIAGVLSVRMALFRRTVSDPIVILPQDSGRVFPALLYTRGGERRTHGVELAAEVRLWLLTLDAAVLYLDQRDARSGGIGDLPAWWGFGGVFFREQLFDDALDLKAGLRGRYLSGSSGRRFNPEVIAYVPNTGAGVPEAAVLDFQLFGRMGDAHIHLVWENLTDVRMMMTPRYPMFGRQITFGIAWEFLD